MDVVICIGRVSRYLERKHFRRFGSRNTRIYNGGTIFGRFKERIWWRR